MCPNLSPKEPRLGNLGAVDIERAETALVSDVDRVEMVLSSPATGRYRVRSNRGSHDFRRVESGYETTGTDGLDPLKHQDCARLLGRDAETSGWYPSAHENSYPYAHDRIAQVFDHPNAPDAFVVRTAAFHVHGNLGEHGSLGAIQSRSTLVAGGSGIAAEGMVDRHLLAVDVAPTIAELLGCRTDENGLHFSIQDGKVDHRLLSGEGADNAIVFLFDGLNPNMLIDALDAGQAPNIASVLARGTCYREGSIASLPTVTLPNHTTILTGLHPGHHGILSNQWHDRSSGESHNLLDVPQMIRTCDHLLPDVETLFEVIARNDPAAFTGATYEYADRGANWSTYGELRGGRRPAGVPPKSEPVPGATSTWAESRSDYHFISRIDTASTRQAISMIEGAADGTNPYPRFLWVNYSLTDVAGHAAGPHGAQTRDALKDTDARMGEVLEAVDAAGALKDTAIFVLSDHGMEQTDPSVAGHYHPKLDEAGLHYLDLDDSLIYLT